ncbi:MAG: hypothetical protein K8S99_05760 [Planctomycetes bacterium]|nr:hypothetical protein [Planctomycetota bacterium]
MNRLLEQLVLERTGPAEATVGLISLPIPRDFPGGPDHAAIDHPAAALQPVGWWTRNELPRRSLAMIVDDQGVPASLRLKSRRPAAHRAEAPQRPWTFSTRITKERLEFKPPRFNDIASLRGVPEPDTTVVEFELVLGYKDRPLVVQFGATGPSGVGPYFHWQNVQVDRLWENDACQAIRVGGIIYNGDTYLWVDLFLMLFANGVAHAAAHFVATRLHVEGYDFQGLPVIFLSSPDLRPVEATLPRDGSRFDLRGVRLNLEDAALLCSDGHPGHLRGEAGRLAWSPFSRTFNPQLATAPEYEWAPGFARTVRFQFSLSEAAPVIARYRAPAWWYALSGEPWPGGYLPVRGAFNKMGEIAADHLSSMMQRGRFDGGSAEQGNDGYAGIGLMRAYHRTGRPDLFRNALDYCYYWADIAVDHRDFTIHQWVGGWPWKTCAYTKFRDVLMGYLETADPYLLDTVESCAETYWNWFRSTWPRCTIGRDAFEVGGWALLRRFTQSERARERSREFIRMMKSVLDTRGVIGGQMGAGPHPGYISSLYMSGVCMVSTLEVAEAEAEELRHDLTPALTDMLNKLHTHYIRDDVELFPSNFGSGGWKNWAAGGKGTWAMLAARIYTQMARLAGGDSDVIDQGLARLTDPDLVPETMARGGRLGDNFIHPTYHDALTIGARLTRDRHGQIAGVELDPIGPPEHLPAEQAVETPWGDLTIHTAIEGDRINLKFTAPLDFPVTIRYRGSTATTTSLGAASLPTKHAVLPAARR